MDQKQNCSFDRRLLYPTISHYLSGWIQHLKRSDSAELNVIVRKGNIMPGRSGPSIRWGWEGLHGTLPHCPNQPGAESGCAPWCRLPPPLFHLFWPLTVRASGWADTHVSWVVSVSRKVVPPYWLRQIPVESVNRENSEYRSYVFLGDLLPSLESHFMICQTLKWGWEQGAECLQIDTQPVTGPLSVLDELGCVVPPFPTTVASVWTSDWR